MEYKIFGCKVNKYYLNKWLTYFENKNFDIDDGCLIASCVVTDRAKSKWLKESKKLLKSGTKVFLTGCGAFDKGEKMDYDQFFEYYPDLKEYKDNFFLLGENPEDYPEQIGIGEYELNKEVDSSDVLQSDKFVNLATSSGDQNSVNLEQGLISTRSISDKNIYTKKFIVIQNGCDTHCTFCLTIIKRGKSSSRTVEDIVSEINEFVADGGKEIVITGINLAAWGAENTRDAKAAKFTQLLKEILAQTQIERIRISSIGPEFLDDEFFKVVENKRILPHFHFSIQSFSDDVLKGMNRNYNADCLNDVLTKIRNLDRDDNDFISLGADIIVGFPGESEDDFQATVDGVMKHNITKLHAFPFSGHNKGDSVPAGKFPNQVEQSDKKTRERELMAKAEELRETFVNTNKGQTWKVMLEEKKDGKWQGWTPNYIQVQVEGDYKKGDIIEYTL